MDKLLIKYEKLSKDKSLPLTTRKCYYWMAMGIDQGMRIGLKRNKQEQIDQLEHELEVESQEIIKSSLKENI